MLNFAERTGCGAVILVWSFLTVRRNTIIHKYCTSLCTASCKQVSKARWRWRVCAPDFRFHRLSQREQEDSQMRQQSQAKVKVNNIDGKQSFKRKGGASASAANISAGGDSDGGREEATSEGYQPLGANDRQRSQTTPKTY